MYHISIYSHYVVIAIICLFGSKDFLKMVLMYFLLLCLICFAFTLLYFLNLWVEAVFFSSVETAPWEISLKQHLQKQQRIHLKACSNLENSDTQTQKQPG